MLEIFIDGSYNPNTKLSAIGIVINGDGHSIKLAKNVNVNNNHSAEFLALIEALKLAKESTNSTVLSIKSDSKVLVDSFEKKYTKNKEFSIYLYKIFELEKLFSMVFIKWIPTKENKADSLAKKLTNIK